MRRLHPVVQVLIFAVGAAILSFPISSIGWDQAQERAEHIPPGSTVVLPMKTPST